MSPQALGEIPLETAIVEKDGTINTFFRERWQAIQNAFTTSPTVAAVELTNQNAAVVTTSAYLVQVAGRYRVSYYIRKTVIDGVSSSLTMTLGWTDHAQPLTEAGAALGTDAVTAQQSGSKVVYADANSDITYAVAYASGTPGNMKFQIEICVERMA